MFKIFGIPIYEGELLLPPASHIRMTEEIKKLKMVHPPAWFADVNTTFNTDPDLHIRPEFRGLGILILQKVKEFAAELEINFNKFRIEMKDMWVNSYDENHGMDKHNHGIDFLSCTYFFSAPEGSSDFVFINPTHEGLLATPTKIGNALHSYRIKPETGKIIIFPSWLEHGVQLNKSIEPRITFSCNFELL
jgi:uncharacterized protein (TIGR02466 family)